MDQRRLRGPATALESRKHGVGRCRRSPPFTTFLSPYRSVSGPPAAGTPDRDRDARVGPRGAQRPLGRQPARWKRRHGGEVAGRTRRRRRVLRGAARPPFTASGSGSRRLQVLPALGEPAASDQRIGTGDGSTTAFALVKRYGAPSRPTTGGSRSRGRQRVGGRRRRRARGRWFHGRHGDGIVTLAAPPGQAPPSRPDFSSTCRCGSTRTISPSISPPSPPAKCPRFRSWRSGREGLPPDLAAHLSGGATTLATCWIVRRRDGAVFGFTDHDRTLTVDGVACEPASGFDRSAATRSAGFAVGEEEIAGALSSDRITEADLADGRWDGASVEVHRVNWAAPTERCGCAPRRSAR